MEVFDTILNELKAWILQLVKQAVTEALREQTVAEPSRCNNQIDIEVASESNLTVAQEFNPDLIGEPSSMGEKAGSRKSFKKTVVAINDASDADKAQLLHDAIAQFPFIEDAFDQLGFKGIEECNFKQDEVKYKLQQNSKKSKAQKAFDMLNYQPGSFHTVQSIKKDLKKVCTSMGQTRRDVDPCEITTYYDVKYTTRKINGFYEPGYLVRRQRRDKIS